MAEAVVLDETGKSFTDMEARNRVKSRGEDSSVNSNETSSAILSQDFHRLMEAFTNQIKLAVPCDGIKYRAEDMNQHFVSGVLDHYLCCFEIKVGERSFGNIYFARETQFLDSELSILENMVAGLVLPLCHLFQDEVTNENVHDSEDDTQVSVSGAVYNKQA